MSDDVKNKIAKAKEEKTPTVEDWINSKADQIQKALPELAGGKERMLSVAITTLSHSPALQACSKSSLLAGLITSAQLGLEINTPMGYAYLIPYKNKGKSEAQFQIGYKGMLELAYRTKQYKEIYAEIVYENDEFHYQLGLNRDLIHVPAESNRGKPCAYYAVYRLTNDGFAFVVKTKEEMLIFAEEKSIPFRKGFNTPWKTDFDEMAKKTVLKMVLKNGPKSADMVKAMQNDGTIKHDIAEDMNNIPDATLAIEDHKGAIDIEPDELTEIED